MFESWVDLQWSPNNQLCVFFVVVFSVSFSGMAMVQLRKPVSTLSIPGSMKTPCAANRDIVPNACNEEAGIALVGVHSEYPR